jgi:hypothetical protein
VGSDLDDGIEKLQQTGDRAMNSATSEQTQETHDDPAFFPGNGKQPGVD